MLKTTYKQSPAPADPSNHSPILPSGWTEHKAPTGHAYYYNAETRQSTYTRPTAPATRIVPPDERYTHPNEILSSFAGQQSPITSSNGFRGGLSYQDRSKREDKDRPKSKHAIPGFEPWILVKTKLGRRFVYNQDKNESFWKFPQDVILAVAEMDRLEREKKIGDEPATNGHGPVKEALSQGAQSKKIKMPTPRVEEDNDSDSYEEVEVTDDEGTKDGDDPELLVKRQKIAESNEEKPLEFDEDDIAYQLAAMGEDYGLDPEEYEGGDMLQGAPSNEETAGLTERDANALFHDLLDDNHINPYRTWESLIENGQIIEDSRYTVLPNMRSRKEAFDEWSRIRIQTMQEQKAKEERKDPRISYVRLLEQYATPRLYWPEFKRKYKKEAEMRDTKLSDKDRERMYRDHIARLKLPEATRKSDLTKLLKDMPLSAVNRSTTVETLPPPVLIDLRFISLPTKIRDPLIESHIATLQDAPERTGDLTAEEQIEHDRRAVDRKKREEALAEREKLVAKNRRKQRGALRQGRDLMRENEMELDQAMRARNDGLLGYLDESGAGVTQK